MVLTRNYASFRYYQQNFANKVLFDTKWRSNFDGSVYVNGALLSFNLPDGGERSFVQTGSSYVLASYDPATQSFSAGANLATETLVLNASNQLELTTPDGAVHVYENKTEGWGKLLSIRHPGGLTYALTYFDAYSILNNKLSSVSDNYGRTLTFSYGDHGHVASVIFNGSTIASYTYEPRTEAYLAPYYAPDPVPPAIGYERAVLKSVTIPNGSTSETTTYHYEDANDDTLLTGVTDARGVRYATFAYDAQGRGISTSHAGSNDTWTFSYDDANSKVTATNPLSKATVYTYATTARGSRLLTSVQGQVSANCPLSNSTSQYDAAGFLSQFTDAEGRVTTYVNDSATGLPTSVTRGYGTASAATTTYTWNAALRKPLTVVESGRTTTYSWDAAGRMTSATITDTTTTTVPYSTNGQTRSWSYAYDAAGLLASVDGPLAGTADRVVYAYDAGGNLKTVTDPLGRVTSVTAVNSRGQPTSITDPNGIVTAMTYDGQGRVLTVTSNAAGSPQTTTLAYDAIGEVTKITEPNGAWRSFAYDGARRLITITSAMGETTSYVRDAMGNATSVTIKRPDASVAYAKTYVYDELGRLIKMIGAGTEALKTYQYGYDRTSNLVAVTDPRSKVFTNGFDALNRLITQKDEENAVVTLTRDGKDDVVAYKDPRTITTTYVRNGFGEIIREVSPDAGTTTYVRDARGLIVQRTDPRGIVANFTYDNSGRPLAKNYVGRAGENVTLTWDEAASGSYPIGRLTTIVDQSGVTRRRYDAQGRMWGEWRTIAAAPELYTWWGRDASGQITQAVYPSGRTVVWNRDAMGRVRQIATRKDGSSPWIDIANPVAWHPWGGVRSLAFANGLTATFDVDKDYRISAVKVLPSSGTGVLNKGLTWTGDTLDKIVDSLDSTRTETFSYSATRRLTSASGKYGAMSWTYDAVGNRASEVSGGTTKTFTTPATSNRLSSVTQGTTTLRTFGYDAAGAITTDAKAGVTWTSTYDAEGRLVQAQSGTFTVGSYVYDAESKLAKRTVSNVTPAVTTHYLYDPDGHVIAETTPAGVTTREYLWLGDMPVAVIDAVNTATPVTYFVHTDHLMRPLKMTNAARAVAWDVVWKPFGETFSITALPKLDLGFPGQWTQAENGLAWNWHRHYDPTTGRYTKPDPLGFVDGPGLYGYAGLRPNVLIDPDGRFLGMLIRPLWEICRKFPSACFSPFKPLFQPPKPPECVAAPKYAPLPGTPNPLAPPQYENRPDGLPGIGPYAGPGVPTDNGPAAPTKEQQDQVNEQGNDYGCHTCGTKDPGTKTGNFVGDHQPPKAIGDPDAFYPHCLGCSRIQGGVVRGLKRP